MKMSSEKKNDIFYIFAQDIDCEYTNEYPQSMFWIKNKKNGIPMYTPVSLYKSEVKGGFTVHGLVTQMR